MRDTAVRGRQPSRPSGGRTAIDLDAIANPSERVLTVRRAVESVADRVGPFLDLCRPYVDGLDDVPRDGRFLMVANHTNSGVETLLIPYLVRRQLGMLVRPLADRNMGQMRGLAGDFIAACGAVVGAPETAEALMSQDAPILVFPGGGREISKFKGEENTLLWKGRSGFARVSVANDYPIVPVALVGGDDVYRTLTSRDSRWGRLSTALGKKLSGRTDMGMPLMRGIGPTLIPRPQRMYLRFAAPIQTTKPARVSQQAWVETVRQRTQDALEETLADLLEIRSGDPYRDLNPLARGRAARPPRPTT